MSRKIYALTLFCLTIIFIGIFNIKGYTVTDYNNPGSGSVGTSGYIGGSTYWPSPYYRAIQIKVLRRNEVKASKFFVIGNSNSDCVNSLTADIYTTTYNYNSIPNGYSFESSKPIYFDCIVSKNLKYTWNINQYNGTYLNEYFKSNDYENLKQILEKMGYSSTQAVNTDVVVVEPATLVKYKGVNVFGTVNGLKYGEISYLTENKVFYYLFNSMTNALKTKIGTCLVGETSNCGYFRYNIGDVFSSEESRTKVKLTIKLVNGSGDAISGVTFSLKDKYGNVKGNGTTNSNGQITFTNLDRKYNTADDYYVLTENVPSKYKVNDSIIEYSDYYGQGSGGPNETTATTASFRIHGLPFDRILTVINGVSCQSEFAALSNKSDPIERIRLYKKYLRLGLLDFENTKNPCIASVDDSQLDISCLSAELNNSFNENNLSTFQETRDIAGNTVFCSTTFSFSNNIGLGNTSYDLSRGVINKSGQIIVLDGILPQATLEKKCYSTAYFSSSHLDDFDYSDYVGDVKFNNRILNITNISEDTGWKAISTSNGLTGYKSKYDVEYSFSPIYSYKGTGEIKDKDGNYYDESCKNCRFLGYGIVSKLYNETNGKTVNVPFSIEYNYKGETYNYKTDDDRSCFYDVENVIVTCQEESCETAIENNNYNLELEFRVIDTNNAFPGKTGRGRTVGSNWCSVTISEIDCTNTNDLVETIMETTNNSYNKNNENPLYTITLTPDTIRAIRRYNDENSYDDYKLTCDDDVCTSDFLSDLTDSIIDGTYVNSTLIINKK